MKENNDKLPIQMKGILFELAQTLRIFSDSKTFPDCVPRVGSDDIKAKASAYIEQCASDLAELWGSNKDDHQEQVVRTAKRMHKLAHQLKQLVNDEFILPAKAQGSIPPALRWKNILNVCGTT